MITRISEFKVCIQKICYRNYSVLPHKNVELDSTTVPCFNTGIVPTVELFRILLQPIAQKAHMQPVESVHLVNVLP